MASKRRPTRSCNDAFQAEAEARLAAMTPEALHALDEHNISIYAEAQGISQDEARAWVYEKRRLAEAGLISYPQWPPTPDPELLARARRLQKRRKGLR